MIEQTLQEELDKLLARRQFEPARELVMPFLYDDPSDTDALLYLGIIQTESGQQEAAIKTLKWYFHQGASSGEAHEALGCAYLRESHYDEAEMCLRAACKALPESSSVHRNLAIVLHKTGREEGAYQELHRSLECNPHDMFALYALIPVVQNLGKMSEAGTLLRRILSLDPPPEIRAYAEAALKRLN